MPFYNLFARAKKKFHQITDAIKTVYYSQDTKDSLNHFYHGISVLNSIRPLQRFYSSERLRALMSENVVYNILFYGSSVLFYESRIKPIIHTVVPALEESMVEDYTYDMAANALFLVVCSGVFVKNWLLTIKITQAVEKESAPKKSCQECHQNKIEPDSQLMDFWIQQRNFLLGKSLRFIPYLGFPVKMFLYGHGLLELQSILAKQCIAHRRRNLNANNFYALGIGAVILLGSELIDSLVQFKYSAQSFYVYDAIEAALYQTVLMLFLLKEGALPGTKNGVDLFNYVHDQAVTYAKYSLKILLTILLFVYAPIKFVSNSQHYLSGEMLHLKSIPDIPIIQDIVKLFDKEIAMIIRQAETQQHRLNLVHDLSERAQGITEGVPVAAIKAVRDKCAGVLTMTKETVKYTDVRSHVQHVEQEVHKELALGEIIENHQRSTEGPISKFHEVELSNEQLSQPERVARESKNEFSEQDGPQNWINLPTIQDGFFASKKTPTASAAVSSQRFHNR